MESKRFFFFVALLELGFLRFLRHGQPWQGFSSWTFIFGVIFTAGNPSGRNLIPNEANTPWKINMELTNHPFRKENDLPGLHDYVPC